MCWAGMPASHKLGCCDCTLQGAQLVKAAGQHSATADTPDVCLIPASHGYVAQKCVSAAPALQVVCLQPRMASQQRWRSSCRAAYRTMKVTQEALAARWLATPSA